MLGGDAVERRRRSPWANTGLALILVAGVFVADRLGLIRTLDESPPDRVPEASTTVAPPQATIRAVAGDRVIEDAFQRRSSGVWVEASAVIERVLADDRDGARHQRFILRLDSGRTVLCAHNIDIAPRVPATENDRIEFSGRYEWNEQGGVIHWTHRDPDGRQPGGWIRHGGRDYQ